MLDDKARRDILKIIEIKHEARNYAKRDEKLNEFNKNMQQYSSNKNQKGAFMTYLNLYEFLNNDKIPSKPENTTRFINKYQQTNCGNKTYLQKAIMDGIMIYKTEGEPNQKWHFTESWYKEILKDNSNICNEDVKYWCGLRCPELLLWIAEVCGQEDSVKRIVDEILEDDDTYKNNDRIARNRMIKVIKNQIKWDDIINHIDKSTYTI